ncbi:MAG TPA: M3 family oligoendopeptidase [Anaerolineae bacterium]|nr:M3 family oligoendopeptidase [Anaerolineae bacterium]HPL29567.1 M3 family oligoendopeptidase [Anaerolineae bacterium]
MNAINTPTRWSLSDLLPAPGGPPLEGALAELEDALRALEAARDRLTPDIPEGDFLTILRTYEAVTRSSARLGAYADLWFSEDTQNQAALNLKGRLEQVLAAAQSRTLFFELWVKGWSDETTARLIAVSGDLHYFLESLRRFKPHTLSEAEEKVITLKDVNGIDALVTVYEMITNKFTFSLEVDGERQTLTRDALSAYFRHPAPEVRAAAYQELYRVYGEQSTVLAQIYNNRVRDWDTEALTLRHYAEPIAVRNLANDIPDAVVDTLLEVARQNATLFQRYFRLKAQRLGLARLRRYDLYAPLARSEKHYEFAEAVDLVLASYRAFSPLLAEQARRVLEQRHLDAELRPGKRGGAFCYATLPELTPWVLANYAGRAHDVATLAHELGHAVHAMMAAGHSALTFHSALPLAETASVFGEMLLTERLLADERDPALRRDLLAGVIDDAYATVMRQAFFALYERDAHRMVAEGRAIDELAAHYLANLAEQFGSAVDVPGEFQWEWISIPHIYFAPFYTYAYSFGQLLVLALYRRYREEGEAFTPRYLRILSYGGSEAPARILAEAGIDIASPEFWQGGFDVIAGFVDELQRS